MTVLARPNHPVRLVGVLAFSVLAFGLVAAAAGAVLFIINNERASGTPAPVAGGTVDLPSGLVQIQRIESFAQWKSELGFAALLPDALPEGVVDAPALYVQSPDASGRLAGHLRYARENGSPAVVLIEQLGTISAEPPLKTAEASGTRMHLQTFTCGSLVVQAQLYFQSEPGPLPSVAQSEAIAASFIEGLRRQCD